MTAKTLFFLDKARQMLTSATPPTLAATAAAVASTFLLGAGCGEDTGRAGSCDGDDVRARLEAARAGQVVALGACTVEGPFVVPRGVSLVGRGPGITFVVGPSDTGVVGPSDDPTPAVRLESGNGRPTVLRGLTLENRSPVAVVAAGDGTVRVEEVDIDLVEGVGVEAIGLDRLVLSRVAVVADGPDSVDEANDPELITVAPFVPTQVQTGSIEECAPIIANCPEVGLVEGPSEGRRFRRFCDGCRQWRTVVPTVGVLLDGVREARFEQVRVAGLARVGVSWTTENDAAGLVWDGGGIEGTVGRALLARGGSVDLTAVEVTRTYQGSRAERSFGAFFVGLDGRPMSVFTTDVTVSRGEGFGLAHVRAAARHVGLVAEDNTEAGAWFGNSPEVTLEEGTVRRNGLAGVSIVASENVTVRNTTIADTRQLRTILGTAGRLSGVEIGDGLQLFDTREDVRLESLTLMGNERTQVAIDLGESDYEGGDLCRGGNGLCFDRVSVDPPGGAAGAFAGDDRSPTAEPDVFIVQQVGVGGWDGPAPGATQGIVRSPAATTVDAELGTPRQVVGVVGPSDFIPPNAVVGPSD